MRLLNKVIIVTGGSGGIGFAIGKRCHEEGATVVLADLKKKDDFPSWAHWYQVDVVNSESVHTMVSDMVEKFGRIDGMVANAGITRDRTLRKMSDAEWDEVIAVNQTGVKNCMKGVLEPMIAQRYGRIVATSSIVGTVGNVGQVNYAATKAAVVAMTKSLALEVGRYDGITVNAIAPGFVDTDMTRQIPEEVTSHIKSKIPLGNRYAKPEELANAFVFLLSDEASYIHGACLPVDGGIHL